MNDTVTVLIGEGGSSGLLRSFVGLVRIVEANSAEEVMPVLREVEAAVALGLSAAGFVAYEAAPGLDSALSTWDSGSRPLAWFGLFEGSQLVFRKDLEAGLRREPGGFVASLQDWKPSMQRSDYTGKVEQIKHYLASGESYQVNLTFKLLGGASRNNFGMFFDILSDYRLNYPSYLSTSKFTIISGSPELFFELSNERILTRPMKGTERRGHTIEEDDYFVEWLKVSEKNRAENLMIVDMIRNDLGKICEPGTVRVRSLFDVERYWTVLQMTSTVEGTSSDSFAEIMAALFPCASITGAPKVRTMEIIKELEAAPRGVYTGCIGYLLPQGRAKFSVAIRTAWVEADSSQAEYGVGGGVVWDSDADKEYEECLLKAGTLWTVVPEFDLLETMLWEGETGYFLLDRHLQRVAGSARYFGYPLEREAVEEKLRALEASMPGPRCKIRVLVGRDGAIEVQRSEIERAENTEAVKVEMSPNTVDSNDLFLYHKTTHRVVYKKAMCGSKTNDVILFNERNEVTESTIANVVVDRGGKKLTPPVECGLLAGTYRDFLLKRGEIGERILRREDLLESSQIWLINSVQKWIPVTLVTDL